MTEPRARLHPSIQPAHCHSDNFHRLALYPLRASGGGAVTGHRRRALDVRNLYPGSHRAASLSCRTRNLTRSDLTFGILSGVFLAIHFATWISSLEYTSVASSVVFVSTGPLWVAICFSAVAQ